MWIEQPTAVWMNGRAAPQEVCRESQPGGMRGGRVGSRMLALVLVCVASAGLAGGSLLEACCLFPEGSGVGPEGERLAGVAVTEKAETGKTAPVETWASAAMWGQGRVGATESQATPGAEEPTEAPAASPPQPAETETPADEPPADEPPADEPPADEPPADKPEADEPAASKPAVTEPAGSPPPPAVPTDDAAPESKPQPKTPGESDSESPAQPVDPEEMTEAEEDAELLKSVRIGDASPMEQAFEEFDAALEEMRSAQERLDESDTGDATRKLQTRAAQRLEEILKLLQQPPPPSSSSSSSSQQQQQQQQQQGQQGQQGQQPKSGSQRQRGQQSRSRGRPQSRAGARAGRRPRPAGNQPQLAQSRPQSRPQSQTARQAGEAQESERPTGGEERRDPARQKAEEADKRRSDANDVWGHLPPTVREALQKSFNERYLPKYEELVRRYYESLAEKRRESR